MEVKKLRMLLTCKDLVGSLDLTRSPMSCVVASVVPIPAETTKNPKMTSRKDLPSTAHQARHVFYTRFLSDMVTSSHIYY